MTVTLPIRVTLEVDVKELFSESSNIRDLRLWDSFLETIEVAFGVERLGVDTKPDSKYWYAYFSVPQDRATQFCTVLDWTTWVQASF